MWLPHFLLEFWDPISDESSIRASDAEKADRNFLIEFALEDPPAHQSGIAVQISKEEQREQTDGAGRKVDIWFLPAESGRIRGVGFRIRDVHPRSAFLYCHNTLTQLLSFWAVICGSGFAIAAVDIVDEVHQAKWRVAPKTTTPEPFVLPGGLGLGDERSALISLYREGRNTQSPFYRFLCCYKVLEARHALSSVFGELDRLIREKSLPFSRPRRRITQEMLVQALVFRRHPEFKDVTFGRFFELLNSWRVKAAHAVTDAGEFVDFDKYEAQIEIGPIANLTDIVARQVLLDELELSVKVNDALSSTAL